MPNEKEIDELISKLQKMKKDTKKELTLDERMEQDLQARNEDRNRRFTTEDEEGWRNMGKPLKMDPDDED